MGNRELYKVITWGLVAFAIITDFPMFITILVAFIIMTIFILPSMDFSEEYARVMRRGEFDEETGWKIMALIIMFFSLVTVLHKPMVMLLGK